MTVNTVRFDFAKFTNPLRNKNTTEELNYYE